MIEEWRWFGLPSRVVESWQHSVVPPPDRSRRCPAVDPSDPWSSTLQGRPMCPVRTYGEWPANPDAAQSRQWRRVHVHSTPAPFSSCPTPLQCSLCLSTPRFHSLQYPRIELPWAENETQTAGWSRWWKHPHVGLKFIAINPCLQWGCNVQPNPPAGGINRHFRVQWTA